MGSKYPENKKINFEKKIIGEYVAVQDEREKLKAQLKVANLSATGSASRIHERDEMIAKLQREGEELARRNGQLEANLRKIRQQLQDAQAERDRAESRAKIAEGQCASAHEKATTGADQASVQVSCYLIVLLFPKLHKMSRDTLI